MRNFTRILLIGAALLLGGNAGATSLDFQDSFWAFSHGAGSVSYPDGLLEVEIGSLRTNGYGFWANGVLTHDVAGGFGIAGVSLLDGEFAFPEVLAVDFSEATYFDSFLAANLFPNEFGAFSLDQGGSWKLFAGASLDGEAWVQVGELTNSIYFTAPGQAAGRDHEFSLAGLRFGEAFGTQGSGLQGGPGAAVPEPAAALLFSAGLLLVARYRGGR